jgi:Domain of unknown function (DUF4440)
MRRDWETIKLADRFFDALERGDYETVEKCYAPEALVWHSHDCLYQPRDANLAMLKNAMQTHQKMEYLDRRIRTFEGGFVQQHTCWMTWANGYRGGMDTLFIAYTRDGMFSRIYEYFDTGQREKFLGPMAAER